jgi:diguanylate cyclase (GGDEF)-like protein
MFDFGLAFTRRLLTQPAAYFGAALMAMICLAAIQQSSVERDAITHTAMGNTANIARVFEQNVIRTISEVDQTLKYIRRARARDPVGISWASAVNEDYTVSDQTLQLAVIDAKGVLIANNLGPQPPKPVDLSDREHFRIQRDAVDDALFISRPLVGRTSGKVSVQLTRRLIAPDGSFDGVLVASLDPVHISKSYSNVDLGAGGGLAVAGTDGLIRAGAGIFASRVGANIKEEPAFRAFSSSPEARDIKTVIAGDGQHILSMRAVHGYPLMLLVARDEQSAYENWQYNRMRYFAGAGVLSLLAALATLRTLQNGYRYERARHALAQSETNEKVRTRELELTLAHMRQGILMADATGKIAVINRQYCDMLSLPEQFRQPGASYDELVEYLEHSGEFREGAANVDPVALNYIKASMRDALMPAFERTRPDGTVLEVRTEALPDGGFVRTLSDITSRRHQEAEIFHMTRHDPLTDLGNRVLLYENLERAVESLSEGRQLAFHAIDLDRFKPVNDTFGHPVGDKLLKVVAERLRMNLRQGDVVARLGGDEFAVIELNDVSRRQSENIARRLCDVLSRPYEIDGQRLDISASIGIAIAPQDACTASGLLKAADLALYTAKAEGRATYRFYNTEIEAYAQTRRTLEAGLKAALEGNQLELYYHPIYDIAQRRISGYEALLRWIDPQRGVIHPAEFVSVAEEAGLIIPIGARVLQMACADMAGQPAHLRVTVNLSAVQFRDPSLVGIVKEALQKSGLAPQRLEIEVTEATLMQKDALVVRQIQELRALGTGVAMDNFGVGYSSLSYLKSHPIDRIKIDRSFVSRIGESTSSDAVVRAVSALAAAFGMPTVAGGVETAAQLEKLAEFGCTEAQGFYFGQPKPADEIFRSGLTSELVNRPRIAGGSFV